MKVIKKGQCVLIQADSNSKIADYAKWLQDNWAKKIDDANIVLDLLPYSKLNLDQLLLFWELSNTHRANKRSFVFVNTGIDYDDIPDEMLVVPTIQEAEDIIKMEEIERDLGF